MPLRPELMLVPRQNEIRLNLAIAHRPAQPTSQAHVLFCAGFHSSMYGVKAQFLDEYTQMNNLGYTRFDYRGHGFSGGDAADSTLHHWLDDAQQVMELTNAPILLGAVGDVSAFDEQAGKQRCIACINQEC